MILIVRHGVTEYNEKKLLQGWIDIPLNDKGKRQIEDLTKKISTINTSWDAVIASDLTRAKESGEIIANTFGVPLLLHRDLRERRYGSYEGMDIELVHYLRNERDQILELGGETQVEFTKRVCKAMDQVESIFKYKNIIIVTHGAFMKNYAIHKLNIMIERIENGQIINVDERKFV